jgi:hypothetical protein
VDGLKREGAGMREEALDPTLCRTRFGVGYRPVARQTTRCVTALDGLQGLLSAFVKVDKVQFQFCVKSCRYLPGLIPLLTITT